MPMVAFAFSGCFRLSEAVLRDDFDAAGADEFFDAVNEEAVGADVEAGGFEDGAELAGLFEVEKKFASARHFHKDAEELVEEMGVGVVERDLDAKGFGKLDLPVFERGDAGDRKLGGGVFFAAEGAANEDGNVDLELLFEGGEGFGEGNELELADGVFQAGGGVHFAAALALGDLETGDDAGDLNFIGGFALAAVEDGGFGLHLAGSGGVDNLEVAEFFAVLVHGVAGDVEAEDFLFVL